MPHAASDIGKLTFIRALVLGGPKQGKSTCCIVSLAKAFGTGYVMCCGDKTGMAPAARRTDKFTYDLIRDETDMDGAIKEARDGIKTSGWKWVFVDDFSLYASFLEGALRDASAAGNPKGEPDGRRYWPEFRQRLLNVPRRLFDLKAHVVFASHYIEQGGEIVDKQSGTRQRAKSGVGIVPMIGGSAREELPALFQDVIFMEKIEARRVFQVNPEGVWGPGSRSVDGTYTIDADFGEFLKLKEKEEKANGKK